MVGRFLHSSTPIDERKTLVELAHVMASEVEKQQLTYQGWAEEPATLVPTLADTGIAQDPDNLLPLTNHDSIDCKLGLRQIHTLTLSLTITISSSMCLGCCLLGRKLSIY
ncbi:hypothetical protein PspLS_00343 [Pyricularia sp. CBS 133598]|nr:hypothetical protein PspLS_00343 [Pyricularia sp. CBS 133598]